LRDRSQKPELFTDLSNHYVIALLELLLDVIATLKSAIDAIALSEFLSYHAIA
jgi:hypothetical protein